MVGIYIHIPFCQSKCIYCDFFSVAARKHRPGYIGTVIKEYQMRKSELVGEPVSTIYIGGGTPSVLPVDDLARILDAIGYMTSLEEITVEVNPDDITPEYATELRRAGFNRVSMGVQSFDDAMLRFLRRRHTAEKAIEAFRQLRNAGFDNISLDLIFALPGQIPDRLSSDLQQIIALRPEHISCYGLMWEEGTLLHRLKLRGELRETDEDTYIEMYNTVCNTLAHAGYEHYEVSNFALPGSRAIHNSNYWNGTPYLGLGAGAHSFDGKVRRFNPDNLKQYVDAIAAGDTAYIEESETTDEQFNDFVMTRLRTADGIDVTQLERRFGVDSRIQFETVATQFLPSADMEHTGNRWRITETGWLRCDAIITALMA